MNHPKYTQTDKHILIGDVVFHEYDGEDVGPYVVTGIMPNTKLMTLISLKPYKNLGPKQEIVTDEIEKLRIANDREIEELEKRAEEDDTTDKIKAIREKGWRIIRTYTTKGAILSLIDTGGVPIWHVPLSKLYALRGESQLRYDDIEDITHDEQKLASYKSWEIPDDIIADLTHDTNPKQALHEAIRTIEYEYDMPEGMLEDLIEVVHGMDTTSNK